MKFLKLLVIGFLALSMTSCGSDEGSPTISATVTGASSSFAKGDVVGFTVAMTDDLGLSTLEVTNEELQLTSSSDLRNELTATVEFTLGNTQDAAAGDYKIKFVVTDSDGNTEDDEVEITITE